MDQIIDNSHNNVNVKNDKSLFDLCQHRFYPQAMFYEAALKIIDNFVEHHHGGNLTSAANALGMKYSTFSRWIKRERTPNGEDLGRMLEKIGARLIPPDESPEISREVCLVNARIAPAGDNLTSPLAEDYLAVPLVEEVGARPGNISQDQFRSWFLVWKHQAAIRNKSDLIAVEITKRSDSMSPTLKPGDVVLVSRGDREIVAGKIYLVMDPSGVGKIRRVNVSHLSKERDYLVTFYSENSSDNPPEVYSLNNNFHGDWDRAIVGRALWAWSDVSTN